MAKFFLCCILLILYWPLALLALIAYPVVWLLLLPFRLAGIAVDGVLQLVRGVKRLSETLGETSYAMHVKGLAARGRSTDS